MHTYSDAIIVLQYAPHCDDVAQAILDRLALEAAGERLLASMLAAKAKRDAQWIGRGPVDRATQMGKAVSK